MGAPRVVFSGDVAPERFPNTIPLGKSENHHLKNVLRLNDGDEVIAVFVDLGRDFVATLAGDALIIKSEMASYGEVAPVHQICFPLCKGEHTELVVEKATELGVQKISIFCAERSVVKLADKKVQERVARWGRIAESAVKQCSRTTFPKIAYYESLTAVLVENNIDPILYASLQPGAPLLRTIPMPRANISIVIGPEGDFTPNEEEHLISVGSIGFSLGRLVLRSETAAIASIAAVNAMAVA